MQSVQKTCVYEYSQNIHWIYVQNHLVFFYANAYSAKIDSEKKP